MPGLDAEQLEMWDYWDEARPTPEPDKTTTMDKVREFAEVMGQKPSVTMSGTLIMEEYQEWLKEFSEFGVPVKELKELADLVYVIYGYANVRHWNLDEAIKRVHQNNIGRCVQPDGSIKRRADGKIIKNPDFPAVVLDDLV
jgi:predicted house-cleaning noncanonical NTP pyrophosphatase (MazG superfamily)